MKHRVLHIQQVNVKLYIAEYFFCQQWFNNVTRKGATMNHNHVNKKVLTHHLQTIKTSCHNPFKGLVKFIVIANCNYSNSQTTTCNSKHTFISFAYADFSKTQQQNKILSLALKWTQILDKTNPQCLLFTEHI